MPQSICCADPLLGMESKHLLETDTISIIYTRTVHKDALQILLIETFRSLQSQIKTTRTKNGLKKSL